MNQQRRLRIAVWHNLPSGGGKRALYYHVRGLAERGHRLECWSLDTADQSYLPLREFAPEHIIPFELENSSTSFSSGAIGVYKDAVGRMRAFDEACARSAREIEAGDFDLLFAASSVLFYMPYVMRHVRRLPKVLYLQEPYRPLYEADPMLPWVFGLPDGHSRRLRPRPRAFLQDYLRLRALRLQARQEWLNAQACDMLLVNSYYSRESILRVYGRDAKVCYLGVDTEGFRDLHLERERFVVSLGSFDKIKRAELAIQSLALLPAPRPHFLWIANSGDDNYRNAMLRLASESGVDLRIRSMITDNQLIEILNKAAVFLYTPRLEPFGFAPLEANACGAPVVAVAEGGVRETVSDGVNGILVDPEPEQIAAALSRLLNDRSLAQRLGKNGAAFVRSEWSVERSVDRLEERLVQVLDTVRGRTAADR